MHRTLAHSAPIVTASRFRASAEQPRAAPWPVFTVPTFLLL
jgi:hypothetical protein